MRRREDASHLLDDTLERRDAFIPFNHTKAIRGLNERVSIAAPRLCVNLSGKVGGGGRFLPHSSTSISISCLISSPSSGQRGADGGVERDDGPEPRGGTARTTGRSGARDRLIFLMFASSC